MKIVYMGTPFFAVPTLKLLLENNHDIGAVVCQPDKAVGRGKKIVYGDVKKFAIEKNLRLLQPESVKKQEFIADLNTINPEIIIVAAYGQILPKEIIDMPKFGCVNIHGSLLPKYRGAAPIQRSIIDGENKTGITIIKMDEKMDAGDMLLKKELDILSDDTYKSLHDKLSALGAKAIMEYLELLANDSVNAIKQNESLITFAPMITKQTGNIDWNMLPNEIINLIRGLNPSPGAYTSYESKKIKIWNAEHVNNSEMSKFIIKEHNKSDFGKVIAVDPNIGILVNTGDGALLITEIQEAGGKRMKCTDYLRGRTVLSGGEFEKI